MKVSFIATVYNEELTIADLLQSLLSQSRLPDEILIADGGSSDNTLSVISNFQFRISNRRIEFKLIVKNGNRSVGRNEAIKKATGDIIACSDAGCILDKDWLRNIIGPFKTSKVDVVAGYYKGKPKSIFQECLIPYVLVMEDQVNSRKFLPASRSMAFRKSIWKKAGGFPEEFSNNEDYVFAKTLNKINANIVFEKNAIIYWMPRDDIKNAFIMFYRFAKGDAQSHVLRFKVLMLFVRYIIGLLLVACFLVSKSYLILNALYLILMAYIFWSVIKNYGYIKRWQAIFILPVLQFTSDIAVIIGTIIGLVF